MGIIPTILYQVHLSRSRGPPSTCNNSTAAPPHHHACIATCKRDNASSLNRTPTCRRSDSYYTVDRPHATHVESIDAVCVVPRASWIDVVDDICKMSVSTESEYGTLRYPGARQPNLRHHPTRQEPPILPCVEFQTRRNHRATINT